MKHTLLPGDVVLVRGYEHLGTCIVVELYKDIPGGVKLDRAIDFFRSWNEDALTLVKRA